MKLRLIIAFIGNLIDMASTLYLINLGYTEINPIMRPLLAHPILFISIKMGLMTTILYHLWQHRTDKHASLLATLAAVVYGGVSVYYGIFFVVLLYLS